MKRTKFLILITLLALSCCFLVSCKDNKKGLEDNPFIDYNVINGNQGNQGTNPGTTTGGNTSGNEGGNTSGSEGGNTTNTNDKILPDPIKSLRVISCEEGIYCVDVRFIDNAPEKGSTRFVFYGENGTSQENSIVFSYDVSFTKNTDGTYEIYDLFNGEPYRNLHNQIELKCMFDGKYIRAGKVLIYYANDGEELSLIYTGLPGSYIIK